MKKLVASMLQKDYRERISVAKVIEDEWFAKHAPEEHIDESVLDDLRRRGHQSSLRTAVFAGIAARQNLAEMRDLNDLFVSLDKNHDGRISAAELEKGLEGKLQPADIKDLVEALTHESQTHMVQYEEFAGWILGMKETEEKSLLLTHFNEYATSQDSKGNFLTVQQLKAMMEQPAFAEIMGGQSAAELMKVLDTDHDEHVDFNEFYTALRAHESTDKPAKSKKTTGTGYTEGQLVYYFSRQTNTWIQTKVVGVDATGILIECKPNWWFRGDNLKRIRKTK